MIDPIGIEHMMYKPGVYFIEHNGKFLLDQNPDSHSSFAYAAKSGHKIQWELSKAPVAGDKLQYTGNVIVDGKEMSKDQAYQLLHQ